MNIKEYENSKFYLKLISISSSLIIIITLLSSVFATYFSFKTISMINVTIFWKCLFGILLAIMYTFGIIVTGILTVFLLAFFLNEIVKIIIGVSE